jgi:hypothetical protein
LALGRQDPDGVPIFVGLESKEPTQQDLCYHFSTKGY